MIFDPSQSGGLGELHTFLRDLLINDWDQPGGAFELSADVTLADIADARHFQNVRIILDALVAEDGTAATVAGAFNRAFSTRMLEQLHIGSVSRESIRRVCKVINESDVPDLHTLRVVCELGGLIARRKNRLRVTHRGQEHLAADHAGSLYRHLFLTFFRTLDLRYIFPLREVPGIQQTLAIILWRLDTVARDWTPVRGLASEVLLPRLLDELRATKYPFDTDEWILAGYVLDPLLDFGLIEKRERRGEWPGLNDTDSIRLTALWHRFLRFSRPD